MAFIEEIPFTEADGSDRVQLDDYYLDDDDYISDAPATPNRDTRRPLKFALNTVDTAKKENEDDVRNECGRLRNAKCAERRHRIVKQHQQGQGNYYDSSTSDLRAIINAARDTRKVIIARQHGNMLL
jgi:hypothetical protein